MNTEEYVERLHKKFPHLKLVGERATGYNQSLFFCEKHGEYVNAEARHILSTKYGPCKKCIGEGVSKAKLFSHEKFVERVEANYPDVEVVGQYEGSTKPVLCRCKKCGYEWSIWPGNVLNYKHHIGCAICARLRTTEELFINEIESRYKSIEVIGKYINNDTPILCRCKICGNEFMAIPINLKVGRFACHSCDGSSMEKETAIWLMEHSIKFLQQKSYEDLRGDTGRMLSYDFYLPDKNMLIECQGGQHYKPVSLFGGDESFERQQRYDLLKREYAYKHNITLLEIPYNASISDILENTFPGGANHPSPSYKAVNPIALSTDKPDTQRVRR